MKKLPVLLIFCFALLTNVKAQTPPNAFNYSAVARNAAGQPIVTTTIGIQISILKTSATGTSQYSENHFVNTDAFGLFNLVIGAGAVQSGSMTAINWSNDNYYLKVGMDATGGTNFLTMGTTQLLSVPYALHSKTAESIIGGGSSGNFNHFIGEEFGGGVIFHLWRDAQGLEHGLVVDKVDLSSSQVWSNLDTTLIGPSAQSAWDGLSNSNAIVTQSGHSNSAAAICLNSTNGGQSDWYLPSLQEFNMLWTNYFTIAKVLSQISSATELQPVSYWSSNESNYAPLYARRFNFNDGSSTDGYKFKYYTYYVRAIRAF